MVPNKQARLSSLALLTLLAVLILVMGSGIAQAGTIYVDAGASGANDGSSWTNAYNYVQDALAVATNGDEIQVAQGTYKPDEDTANPTGTGDRTATFQVINSVTLKGGYGGETILSGDLNGDDGPDFANNSENSYHVVTGSGTDSTAILDGFTITEGNANGVTTTGYGGGMFNDSGSPAVTNCTFIGNSASISGGGMATFDGSPAVTNCTFSGNTAKVHGGGMWSTISSPTAANCTFNGNSAPFGGGMFIHSSSQALDNCILWGNTSTGAGPQITMSVSSALSISYSDLQGGQPAIYKSLDSSITWGLGNIDLDPLFVNPSIGDYHLKASSPCIDAGDNAAVPAGITIDLDDNPRVVDGDEDGTAIVDMGAFETIVSSTPPGDVVDVMPVDPVTGDTPVTVTFDHVSEGGVTTVTATTPSEQQGAPQGFKFGNPPVIYEISTTANYYGNITVSFDYSGANYGNEANLRLFHRVDGAWVDITDPDEPPENPNPDTVNKTISGTVTSLSFFALFERELLDPVELLDELAWQVFGLNLQNGIENSLDAKLDAALGALDDVNANNDVAAINTLLAFINAVQAQRGNKIPEADADSLIATAQTIVALLSGA